ncbi:hypothetical protein MASR2M54_12340 [Aliarcobacter cryaerophilus]
MLFFNSIKNKIKQNNNICKFKKCIWIPKGFISLLKGKRGAAEHIKSTYSLVNKSSKILVKL